MKKLVSIFILAVVGNIVSAKTIYYEKDYQNFWCMEHNGQIEVILPDNTRVDCLTDTHAIEFDFAKKWGESIGQALYYSISTGKKPGIVLIMENGESDKKYLHRVNIVAKAHNITVWTIYPQNMLYYGLFPTKK